MGNTKGLRTFLEIPYDELSRSATCGVKEQRHRHRLDKVREERIKYLTDESAP